MVVSCAANWWEFGEGLRTGPSSARCGMTIAVGCQPIVMSARGHSRDSAARSLYLKQVANRVVASGIVSSPFEESPGSIGRAAR
jgi:hypothetical protein